MLLGQLSAESVVILAVGIVGFVMAIIGYAVQFGILRGKSSIIEERVSELSVDITRIREEDLTRLKQTTASIQEVLSDLRGLKVVTDTTQDVLRSLPCREHTDQLKRLEQAVVDIRSRQCG